MFNPKRKKKAGQSEQHACSKTNDKCKLRIINDKQNSRTSQTTCVYLSSTMSSTSLMWLVHLPGSRDSEVMSLRFVLLRTEQTVSPKWQCLSPYSRTCRLVAITDEALNAVVSNCKPCSRAYRNFHLLSVRKIKEHGMGGTCRTDGSEDKCVYRFVEKHERGRPSGGPSIRWDNNVKLDLKEIRYDCMEWDQLALDWDKGSAVVKMVMHNWGYKMRETFWADKELLTSVEGICWLELDSWLVG